MQRLQCSSCTRLMDTCREMYCLEGGFKHSLAVKMTINSIRLLLNE